MSWKVLEFLKGLRSSKGTKEVIKCSWNVLQCSESIRPSGLQKVLKRSTKSTKGQENAQKGPQRPQASGPQVILKLLKRSSKSLNSPKVLKRYSNRPQSPQKFINVLNSSVGNQVRKDPQCPEKSLNSSKGSGPQKVHKKSSKGPENSSMLWDPQVLRS